MKNKHALALIELLILSPLMLIMYWIAVPFDYSAILSMIVILLIFLGIAIMQQVGGWYNQTGFMDNVFYWDVFIGFCIVCH